MRQVRNNMLQRAIAYCDEQAGIAVHDPEGIPNHEESTEWQIAANILEALKEASSSQEK